ncbi:MAG: DUF3160 domain-containing protein, partial [Candidatus Thorarchaeota archaeon]
MASGGIIASLLAVSMVITIGIYGGVFVGPYNPYTPNGNTANQTVSNSFADYIPYDVEFTPNAPTYSIAPNLSNVVNLDQFPDLTTEEITFLEQNGFVVRPQNEFNQTYEILEENKDDGYPNFITTDSVLHAFHILYDLTLREAEFYSFWDLLGNLTNSMLEDSYEMYASAPEGIWKDAALRNIAYFTVPAYLMDNSTVVHPEVASIVNNVLELIEEHALNTSDWFMEYFEDFTQFVPRGHYTRSETLSKYFMAMMWYGRVQFRLSIDETGSGIGLEHTPQAIMIALMLENVVTGLNPIMNGYDVWDAIYEPTAFFVGSADDLNPPEYLDLIGEIYDPEVSWDELQNETLLLNFIAAASELREPLILGSPLNETENLNETKGMRFMGQRFIPDSYILGQLVYKNVGTQRFPRLMPKGLDVMAALGSERAWELLDDQKVYARYVEQMETLRSGIVNITIEEWTQNLYYLWLYSLLPLLTSTPEGYPIFMSNQAWTDKQLYTALGSWTELRHDTILYAKQSYTYLVKGAPPLVNGYVEPVPELYARLASLCRMLVSGLDSRSLLSERIREKLEVLLDFLLTLKSISVKELTGEPLNATEWEAIFHADSKLEFVSKLSTNGSVTSVADKYMSVIADVHTDPNTNTVLEEAVGDPLLIFVVVLIDGEVKLTRGGTFSYYEFVQPMSDRLTDEAWRDMLDQGLAPSV